MNRVRGLSVGGAAGCAHYRSPLDIVAIKFKCCGEYYACHLCHQEIAGHDAKTWSQHEHGETAILCRACKEELTILEYMNSNSACPRCGAAFNPGCKGHWPLYFD